MLLNHAVLGGVRLTFQLGLDNVPAEAFESADVERILALAAEAAALPPGQPDSALPE